MSFESQKLKCEIVVYIPWYIKQIINDGLWDF